MPMENSQSKKNPVQAVERAFAILELLSRSRSSLSAIEISQELGLKRTTVYGLLESLMQMGYALRVDNKYTISGKMFHLSYTYPNRFRVAQVAESYMCAMAQKYECTSHLGILSQNTEVLLIRACFPNNVDRIHSGSMFPLHASSMGKVLLAFQPEETRQKILQSLHLTRYTSTTITSLDALTEELDRIRELGYGEDRSEYLDDTHCLAVPVFNEKNAIVAAMSFSSDEASMRQVRAKLLPEAAKYGKNCSITLGWNPLRG